MQLNMPVYFVPVAKDDPDYGKIVKVLFALTCILQLAVVPFEFGTIAVTAILTPLRLLLFILLFLTASILKFYNLALTFKLITKPVVIEGFLWTAVATVTCNGVAACLVAYQCVRHLKNGWFFLIHVYVVNFLLLLATNILALLYIQSLKKSYFSMNYPRQQYYYPQLTFG
eukprot:TRINITY_DN979_c0_g1_i2.p1 TRINITY_DN979_c0_g1~~TRINITY_DN979_c0_g1_i2.p1  ORF type:complete len:171 (+),score=28.62 TRINITY_DN979_c0_g1_i2:99-611(+)